MPANETVWFVFDGECPLCHMGASLYKLKQSVGEFVTVDARTEQNHPVMQEVLAAGLDLNEGMVVKYRDALYHGRDALHLMATLGADDGALNKLNHHLFKHKPLATFCYPSMKVARSMALKIKGVGPIRALEGGDE